MKRVKTYISDMRKAFGTRFLVLLFLIQCLLKGVVFIIMTSGMLPLFKSMGIGAVQLQMYAAIAMSPWTLKPAIGLISDLFPLGGYHKRYYLLFSLIMGIFGIACMVANIHIPALIVLFVFCAHICISVCDLLTEAAYAKLMRENPQTGSSIVTLVQGFQQVGFLIALSFMGVLSDHNMFSVAYGIALVCIATPIIPLLRGWLPENKRQLWEDGIRRVRGSKIFMVDRNKLRTEWRILLLVGLTGLAGPILGVITAFGNEIVGLVGAILVLVGITFFGYRIFPRVIANVALYQILTQVSRVSVGSALDYFFTANEKCLPGGPHFNYTFYVSFSRFIKKKKDLCVFNRLLGRGYWGQPFRWGQYFYTSYCLTSGNTDLY
jgi:MFS family permease